MTTQMNGGLGAWSEALAEAIARAGNFVVTVNARPRRTSSGIHWQPGLILTADETIKREDDITITLPDGSTVNATLVGRDAGTDLALLRVEGLELPTAALGDTTALRVGHLVLALGRSGEGDLSASLGMISTLGGSWRSWYGGQIDQYVRPDLTLYPGFAGGPLLDLEGRVVGMNTTSPRNLPLTIPVATIERVVGQLMQRGRLVRGYLGIGMQPVQLPESLVRSLNLPNPENTPQGGVVVISLAAGSPAEQAGVLIGDILIALGGASVCDVRDVFAQLGPEQVGQAVVARIIRGGAVVELPLQVGERPGRG